MQDTNQNSQAKTQNASSTQQAQSTGLLQQSTTHKTMPICEQGHKLDRLDQMLDRISKGQQVEGKQLLATDFNALLDQIIDENQKALEQFDEIDERLEEIKEWIGMGKE